MGTQPGTGHCPELEDDLPEAQWYQQGVRLSALEHQNLNQCVCVCLCLCLLPIAPYFINSPRNLSTSKTKSELNQEGQAVCL